MEAPRVIKLPRDDQQESGCVLLQVTQNGPEALDLCLEASEGLNPYFAYLKHEEIASLRAKRAPASDTEWQSILHSVLSQKPLPGIHATASVQDGTSMVITVRKQVQGITQRLGSVSLKCDALRELDIFQWCVVSQDALRTTSEALEASASRARELELTVHELRTQLDDVISTKQADEALLLQKFSELLNEKKVKIRHQAKIIATACDASHPSPRHRASPEPSPSAQPPPRRTAAKSRIAKRKAPAEEPAPSGDDDPEALMDVDKIKSEPEENDGGLLVDSDATASGSDKDIKSDDDDDDFDGFDSSVNPRGGHEGAGRVGPHAEDASRATQRGSERRIPEAPPPPRSLPFVKKKGSEPKQADPGTDSEDDEL